MEAVDVRGRFVWHHLMTRDVPGARDFYSNLAGWTTTAWPLDSSYTICQNGDAPVASITPMPADAPVDARPNWTLYIGTRDVDGTIEAAIRAGGSLVKPAENLAGAGRYAVLKDPQGAVFAIIDPEKVRPDPGNSPPPGYFSWYELATTDHEAAFAFYHALFGWEALQRVDMGAAGVYLIFGRNGEQRGGMYIQSPEIPAPPNWTPYVTVPSVDNAFRQAIAMGATQLFAPMDVPGGSRVAGFLDPAGAAFCVHAKPEAGAASSVNDREPVNVAAKPKASKPKAEAKAKPKARVKTKARPKTAAKAKAKGKPKSKSKSKTKTQVRAKKPAARKKAARKPARRPAAKKSRNARRKK